MMDIADWLTPAEQEKLLADVREMEQELNDLSAWLQSPEGQAWGEQQMEEVPAMAEEFAGVGDAGKHDRTPAGLAQ